MKLAYIAGPYRDARGPWYITQNIEAARRVAVVWWRNGWAVICPHSNTSLMDGVAPDEAFLEGDLVMLRRCDAIVMVPGWERSSGASAELAEAQRLGLEVYFHRMEVTE